ncbi:MAG: hydrolase [Dehalococcoidia bacterium]|nr:MAG: hydrolase [Dehalococcoidia bacterium]
MGKQRIQVNGLDLRFVDFGGEGPPCLLLHGATSHALAWSLWVKRTPIRMHFIALEQRGHGDSAKPSKGYGALDFGRDAAAFWEQLGLPPAVVMGASLGGNTAMAMAVERPDLCRALILSDPAYKIPPHIIEASVAQLPAASAGFDDWSAVVRLANQRFPGMTEDEIRMYYLPNLDLRPDGGYRWKWSTEALRQVHEHFRDDLFELARSVRVPTLIVQAGERRILPDDVAAEMVTAIPNAELVVIEGAGHSVHIDKQPEFDAAMAAFLGRCGISI